MSDDNIYAEVSCMPIGGLFLNLSVRDVEEDWKARSVQSAKLRL